VTKWYQSHVDRRSASLVRRVLPLVLFYVFAKILWSLLFYPFSSLLSNLNSDSRWLFALALILFFRWPIGIPRSVSERISQCSMYFWGNGVMDWMLDTSPIVWWAYSRSTDITTCPSTSAHGDHSTDVLLHGECKWYCTRRNWATTSVWFDICSTLHPILPLIMEFKMLLIKR
jgi:hypothetical protein